MAAVDVAEPEAEDDPALADSSRLPVTSTLWPTCGVNFESSASSRYCAPALAVPARTDAVLEPELAEVDWGPIDAFINMNPPALAVRVEPDVPVVPVALSVPRWRHPVIVTERADVLCDARPFCDLDDERFCATTAVVIRPTARAAQAVEEIRVVIMPPGATTIDACVLQLSDQSQPIDREVGRHGNSRLWRRWGADGCTNSLLCGPVCSVIPTLSNDVQFEVALLSEDGDADIERLLLEEQIGLPERQLQIEQPDVAEKRRQNRVIDG